ncbi:type IX secretion system membrane protein PorP/SprF [Fulvivirga sedimenti]|uniref:Type IX secretion system membrane protein PorP/SprF n=1 Tax=Fulvivirga sedimenti TaxID=2879465 RepID=A0A9X1HW10_9BACT|nr:type IX secretion system membrane protein PorP/SprF [Fulvivirga sedimenti]MCA6078891.1 type IX secretion system membrane protein PorP/SprF [Fulvivirga sedimenti]
MDNFLTRIVTLVLMMAIGPVALCQQVPVYNHYFINPYLYNPAEAGSEGYTTLHLNHRQQWRGIDGAPVVSTLTFELPFNSRSGNLGIYLRSYDRGLITTQDIMATFAYRLYLTKTTTFSFGISAGVTTNGVDMNAIDDPDDPVLVDFLNNNMQPAANAGFVLNSGSGFNLGVSLPRLFNQEFTFDQNFKNTQFSPFEEIFVTAYYRKQYGKKIVTKKVKGAQKRVNIEGTYAPLQFYLIYRYSQLIDERIEAMLKLDLGEHMWVGGSYRLNYGLTGMVGFNFGNLSLGYAYEPASQQVSGFTNGTHEVNLRIRFGERKEHVIAEPVIKTVSKPQERSARFSSEDIDEGKDSMEGKVASKKKYYVVVKSFKDFNSADNFVRRLAEKELYTNIFYNKADKNYYVYTYETLKQKEAKEQEQAVYKLTKYRSVMILTIDLE